MPSTDWVDNPNWGKLEEIWTNSCSIGFPSTIMTVLLGFPRIGNYSAKSCLAVLRVSYESSPKQVLPWWILHLNKSVINILFSFDLGIHPNSIIDFGYFTFFSLIMNCINKLSYPKCRRMSTFDDQMNGLVK